MEIMYPHSCLSYFNNSCFQDDCYANMCVLTAIGSNSARGARGSCVKVKMLERFSVIQHVAYEAALS